MRNVTRAMVWVLATVAGTQAAAQELESEWSYFGGDEAYTRYSPLDQVDRDYVHNLKIVWRRPAVDPEILAAFPDLQPNAYLRSTPIMVDGVLYAPNALGLLDAFDPASGETVWRQAPLAATLEEVAGRSTRGAAYWSDGVDQRLLLVRGEYLYALDPATGRRLPGFGFADQGRVALHWDRPLADRFSWSSGPIVVGDVVVVAGTTGGAGDGGVVREAAPEDVRGFDVRSGELLWTFHVVPQPGEFGADTWGNGSGGYSGDLGSWCCLTADEELGHVYVPLSAPTGMVYGGHRPGDNLFSDSLVAIEVSTGKRVWHFQMVHHDVWEYDTVGPPTLGDIIVEGRRIKAVMQPSKTAFLYVFDRETGEPVWPIEERPVPPSGVPGETLSPTQPFPTNPPPFEYQGVTEDLLIDFTPELRAEAVNILQRYAHGELFTPQTLYEEDGTHGTLQVPGSGGGANWSGAGANPETGFLYVPSRSGLTRMVLVEGDPSYTNLRYVPNGKLGPKSIHPDRPAAVTGPRGLPLIKPPYSRLTAYDMNRGAVAWQTPTGPGADNVRHHPALAGLDLPPLGGQMTTSGPLVTKTLVALGLGPAGEDDTSWLIAYDKTTGDVMGQVALPSRPLGTPMTYLIDGRQFIVLTLQGAQMVALALP